MHNVFSKIGSQGGDRVVALCKSIQQNSADLANLCAAGAGDTPQALDLAKRVATDLGQLKEAIQTALVDKVVEDFMDVVSPLKVTSSYNHFGNSFIHTQKFVHFANFFLPYSNLLMWLASQVHSRSKRH